MLTKDYLLNILDSDISTIKAHRNELGEMLSLFDQIDWDYDESILSDFDLDDFLMMANDIQAMTSIFTSILYTITLLGQMDED